VSFGLPAIGPELRAELHLSLPGLGAVLAAPIFGSGLALIPAGIVVDRVGARAATLAGTLVATSGLALAASAGRLEILLAALALFGVGASVVPVAGAGALFHAYPPARRGWALGVRQMAVPLGGTVAAVAMPVFHRAGGVELALAVAAGMVAVAGVSFALLPEKGPSPVSRRGRERQPLLAIWRASGMRRLLLVASLYIVVLQAVISYAVPAMREAGLSSLVASATFFALNVTAMVARIVWGKVADREQGSRRARTLAEAGLVAAAGACLFAAALHTGAAGAVVGAVILGFGALGWNGLLYVAAGERAHPELAGRSVAVAATVVFLVSAASTPPLGALAAEVGWDVFWVSTAAVALAGAVLALGLGRVPLPEETRIGTA